MPGTPITGVAVALLRPTASAAAGGELDETESEEILGGGEGPEVAVRVDTLWRGWSGEDEGDDEEEEG